MTLIDSLLDDRDRRDYALLKDFKSHTAVNGPGTSPEIREHVAQTERRLGDSLRAGVSDFVNADPNLSALADELVREAVRRAR